VDVLRVVMLTYSSYYYAADRHARMLKEGVVVYIHMCVYVYTYIYIYIYIYIHVCISVYICILAH